MSRHRGICQDSVYLVGEIRGVAGGDDSKLLYYAAPRLLILRWIPFGACNSDHFSEHAARI